MLAASALLAPYARRWQIDAHPAGLDIWSAIWRSEDGRHIRVLIARTPTELASKLEAADEELDQMLTEANHKETS
jgi:hypothetical protein